MRFLLVAPLLADAGCPDDAVGHVGAVADQAVDQASDQALDQAAAPSADAAWHSDSMRNRQTYVAQDLAQQWRVLEERVRIEAATAESVALVTVHGQVFLTCVATMDLPAGPSSLELEEACNAVVTGLLDRFAGGYRLRWVNRTLLLEPGDTVPAGWLAPGSLPLPVGCDPGPSGAPSSRVGWGNNVIVGYDEVDPEDQQEIRRGLIDGQAVWTDLEGISAGSAELARAQASSVERGRRELEEATSRSEQLLIAISRHNLLFDDLGMNIQGCRRTVAETLLQAWGYERMIGRVNSRVRDIEMIAGRQRQRLDSAYQRAVEALLLLLGIVSGAQLIIGLVALAYSGNVTVQPGGDSHGLMYLLRTVNTDVWVLITALLVLITCVYVGLLKKRVR